MASKIKNWDALAQTFRDLPGMASGIVMGKTIKPSKSLVYCYACKRRKMLFGERSEADNDIGFVSSARDMEQVVVLPQQSN